MKNKKLFVKYKMSSKIIQTVTLLSLVFLMVFVVSLPKKAYGAETGQTQENLVIKILQLLFSANGNSSGNTSTNPDGTTIDNTIIPPADSTDVAGWAQLISSKLQLGTGCKFGSIPLYCRLVTRISNGDYTTAYREGFSQETFYWCTRLVIDSVNLAGKRGFTTSESVIEMINFWNLKSINRSSGYSYMPYYLKDTLGKESYLKNLRPGCAFFQVTQLGKHTGYEHVSVVKTININSQGDGNIITIDSNSDKKENKAEVDKWQIKNTFYPYVSFGCFN